MTITYHTELIQGSDSWLSARCGLLTASEIKLIVTPTLKIASNDKERAHLYELLAQRITKYVEPSYIGADMLRGYDDEIEARRIYHEKIAPVEEMGFITNDKWGFTLGFSPDGLVGDDGFLEGKSRRQKYQIETMVECVLEERIPVDYLLQEQTGHLVSERGWCDFISYSGGLPMVVIRVYPDEIVQDAIINAAGAFEKRLREKMEKYAEVLASKARMFPTERRVEKEMYLSV
jgi:hypothetical protein